MTNEPESPSFGDDYDWLRGFARYLVHDEHLAEDLAQDAMLVALKRSGEDVSRGWLAGVIRNLLFKHLRTRGRIETDSGVVDQLLSPSEPDVAGRTALQSSVAEVVASLPEPYRATVTLRFLRQFTPEETAAVLGVATKTVYSRLERAQPMLRERLDRKLSRRDRLLILGLVGVRAASRQQVAVRVAVGVGSCLAATVVALVWLAWESTPRPPAKSVVEAAVPRDVDLPSPQSSPSRVEPSRSSVPLPVDAVHAETSREGALQVRVRDASGVGVAAVSILFQRREANDDGVALGMATTYSAWLEMGPASGPDGRAQIESPGRSGRLIALSDDYCTLIAPKLVAEDRTNMVEIVVGRKRRLSGKVRDPQGRGIEGAYVSVFLDDERYNAIRTPNGTGRALSWKAWSDARGEFGFDALPSDPGLTIRVAHPRYSVEQLPITALTDDNVILLGTNEAAVAQLKGRVVDAAGQPVIGAFVSGGEKGEAVQTDVDGRFAIAAVAAEPSLVAVSAGTLPAYLTPVATDPDELILTLGSAAPTIRGRATDQTGRALPRVVVWLEDATPFGIVKQAAQRRWLGSHATVEQLMRGAGATPVHAGPFVAVADGSEFELPVLPNRTYTVRALDFATFTTAAVVVNAGESNARIRIATDRTSTLNLRFRYLDGSRVVGLRVYPGREVTTIAALAKREAILDPSFETTDADGIARFATRSADGFTMQVSGENVLVPGRHTPTLDPLTKCAEISVSRRCEISIEPAPAESPQWLDAKLSVIGLDDKAMMFLVHDGLSESSTYNISLPREEARSIHVDERARYLSILWNGDASLHGPRKTLIPIDPNPSQPQRVRLP